MKIGITGAFGFLGANFAALLLEAGGYELTAFSSRGRSNPLFDAARTRIAHLELLDGPSMAQAFRGLDAVAHFAGRVDFRASRRREVWDANALGTERLIEAARSAGVGRLLLVSSINVLGASRDGRLLDEGDAPYGDPRSVNSFSSPDSALAALASSRRGDYGFLRHVRVAYLDSKLAARELARSLSGRGSAGPEIVTIIPGTAIGAGDVHRSISELVDRSWEGRMGLAFEGASSFVDAQDFARGAILALERGKAGEEYLLSGRDEENLSYAELIGLIRRVAISDAAAGDGATCYGAASTGAAGTGAVDSGAADSGAADSGAADSGAADSGARAKGVLMPPFLAPRSLALLAARVAELLDPEGSLTKALVLSGTLRNVCSSAKARAELGYVHRRELADSIIACRRFSEAGRNLGQ